MDFNLYKQYINKNNNTIGDIFKQNSDMIMLNTWDRDIQSKKCYIYDYYHDKPELKTPVDAKFIITQYGTLSKDQVECHIMFKPNHKCELPYFDNYKKYHMEYPLGLYIDIPDESGKYRKWLICLSSKDNQFIKYTVLPCNYKFQWIYNGVKYSMWGVARMRNSYNAGIWTDYRTTTVENQDQMWLPMNDISAKIYYGQRIIVSALLEKPITWQISKVENVHPFGINKLTLSQDKFNPELDYVNFDTGEMYANYYDSYVLPEDPQTIPSEYFAELILSGTQYSIRVPNKQKEISVKFKNDVNIKYTWVVMCENENIIDNLEVIYPNYPDIGTIQISTDDFLYVGHVFDIYIVNEQQEKLCDSLKLEVISF